MNSEFDLHFFAYLNMGLQQCQNTCAGNTAFLTNTELVFLRICLVSKQNNPVLFEHIENDAFCVK